MELKDRETMKLYHVRDRRTKETLKLRQAEVSSTLAARYTMDMS